MPAALKILLTVSVGCAPVPNHFLAASSSTEIAREAGISRQGVHDLIRRCNQTLSGYEEKLHLVEKLMAIKEKTGTIKELLDGYEKERAEEIVKEIRNISDEIIEEL